MVVNFVKLMKKKTHSTDENKKQKKKQQANKKQTNVNKKKKVNTGSKRYVRRPGIEPGSTAWKAAMLTTIPPTLDMRALVMIKFHVFRFLHFRLMHSVSPTHNKHGEICQITHTLFPIIFLNMYKFFHARVHTHTKKRYKTADLKTISL